MFAGVPSKNLTHVKHTLMMEVCAIINSRQPVPVSIEPIYRVSIILETPYITDHVYTFDSIRKYGDRKGVFASTHD